MMWASGMCLHKQIWQHSFGTIWKLCTSPWAATTWKTQRSSPVSYHHLESQEVIPSELPPPGELRGHSSELTLPGEVQRSSPVSCHHLESPEIITSEPAAPVRQPVNPCWLEHSLYMLLDIHWTIGFILYWLLY